MTGQDEPAAAGPSRRALLQGAGLVAAAGAAGAALGRATAPTAPGAAPAGTQVPVYGSTQAGVARPSDAQTNCVFTVADLAITQRSELAAALAGLGSAIAALADSSRPIPEVSPDGPGDLTVTVGVGPRLVALAGSGLPGAQPLPSFIGDDALADDLRGGDLLLAVQASDAVLVGRASDHLLAGLDARRRWAQQGFRTVSGDGRSRNVLGFLDGVAVPRTADDLAQNVWIASGPAAGGTICVVRRLAVDVAQFGAQPLEAQEASIGRRIDDGTPLSGGGPLAAIDVAAKTPEGEWVVPESAHARAAHPAFTGSAMMLRRSYNFADGSDRGVLFTSFQRDLDTFVKTQHRMDEIDSLLRFTRLTASGSFLVLPGFAADRPLGAGLFG